MGDAYFYHLTRQPLEAALPKLLELSLSRGWRVCVRARDAGFVDWLDQLLWRGDEAGFLPHGVAGGDHDARQPVLLTREGADNAGEGPSIANDPSVIMAVNGASVSADEVRGLERVCVLFDGGDATALDRARSQWRDLTTAGCGAQYWSDEGGGWTKKTSRPAAEVQGQSES